MADSSDSEAARAEQHRAKMDKEYRAIIGAIGDATTSWSMLENNLATIFSYMAFEVFHSDIAGLVFYSPNSFDARFRLVDDLMMYRFAEAQPEIHKLWTKIKGKIQSKQRTRNAIAHGSLVSHRNIPRLAPGISDTLRMLPSRQSRQLPGMSANDILDFAKSVGRICDRLNVLSLVVARYLGADIPSQPPVTQTLPELIAQLDKLMA
jgi:hypothetical protein